MAIAAREVVTFALNLSIPNSTLEGGAALIIRKISSTKEVFFAIGQTICNAVLFSYPNIDVSWVP